MARIVSHGIVGSVAMAANGAVAGWAVDPALAEPLALRLFVDGKEVATAICDGPAADAPAKDADGDAARAGFRFEMPPSCHDGIPHIVQLRARDSRLIVFRDGEDSGQVISLDAWRKDGKARPPAAASPGNPAYGFIFLHERVNRLGTAARILREKHLADVARASLGHAGRILFSAPFVRDAVLGELGLAADGREMILPQGCYRKIRYDTQAAMAIRAELGLADDVKIVLGAGYADLRKGFDLFLQLWRSLAAAGGVCVVWVGGIDPGLQDWLGAEIAAAEATGTFRMAGYRDDMAAWFSAASAFALTSREDPLPSVVMEALSTGLPVCVFDKSGGMPGLLRGLAEGEIVPYGDTAAMARAVKKLLAAGISSADRARRREKIAEEFDFCSYAHRPNYNCARHLPGRLASVFAQTYPVREVIVLDDASADDSVAVAQATARDAGRTIRLVVNARNAGSVFAQWRRAAELAAGEFVWIAEADDLAEPAFLARIAALLARDDRMAFAFCDSRTVRGDGSPQWPSFQEYYATTEPGALRNTAVFEGEDFVRRFMAVKNPVVNASAVVWRKSALLAALDECGKALGRFRMAGDWLLYLTAAFAPGARIGFEAGILNIHRRHEESVTHRLDAAAGRSYFSSLGIPGKRLYRENQHKFDL